MQASPPPVIRRRSCGDADVQPGLHPLLERIYRNRGITSAAERSLELSGLPPPNLKGLPQAVEILTAALTGGRRLLLVGDYDADGATGCALGMLALRAMGFSRAQTSFLVPDRFRDGYGLRPELVRRAALMEPPPEILITVDNGITAVEGVAVAREQGMEVIITDHHLPGAQLPPASAIVNPMQPDCPFPAKHLAGVGVLFYLLCALCSHLRAKNWFAERGLAEPRMADYLDLVAVGTVADVVPLDHCNRVLVHQGIQRIRAGRARPGIIALLEAAGRDPRQTSSADLAFAVAPRINAAGRLDDITMGIACLCADALQPARDFMQTLETLNRERQVIGHEMLKDAEAELAAEEEMPMGLCLYNAAWHQGVAGILASRIRERWCRPALVCTDAGQGEIRGSGRSVPGLHLRDVLAGIDARCPGLLTRFGGHAAAAGFSLQAQRFDELAKLFDEEVRRHLPENPQAVLWSDGELLAADFHIDTARMLRDASPWGQGFPEPLFDGEFQVLEQRVMGAKHLRFRLQAEHGPELEAVWFNPETSAWAEREPGRLRAAYSLDASSWRGRERFRLQLRHAQPA